jgi:hypothetical protein
MKTETVVKNHFAGKQVRPAGEWFALSQEDFDNLLDEEWRIRHHIY